MTTTAPESATTSTTTTGTTTTGTTTVSRVGLARQTLIEFRKMLDTRAGRALLIISAGLVFLASSFFLVLDIATSGQIEASFPAYLSASYGAAAVLVPVVGILLVTSEWSQRTAQITFTLEPRRMVVSGAKLIAGVATALGAIVLSIGWSALANVLTGMIRSRDAVWAVTTPEVVGGAATVVLPMLTAMAFAMLILNTPAAVAAYAGLAFVLPTAFPLLGLWEPASKVIPWIDFAGAQLGLTAEAGPDWGHLLVSGVIWLVVPLVIGAIRIHRKEVS